MIIEYEGNKYSALIKKPILKGDLYFDCMTNEVKTCNSFICFDPWSLKMEELKTEEHEEI